MARRKQEPDHPTLDFEAGGDPFEEPVSPPSPVPPPVRRGRALALDPGSPMNGTPEPPSNGRTAPSSDTAHRDSDLLDDTAIRGGLGRSLRELVDLKQWEAPADAGIFFRSLGEQARRAVEQNRALREPFRRMLAERVREFPDAHAHAGLHPVKEADLERVAKGFLYNGLSEAVAGHFVMHETVPFSIGMAAIAVVGYSGRHDQYHQRLLRQELPIVLEDPMAAAEEVLEMRLRGRRPGARDRFEQLSELARRGVVSYMERLVMAEACPGKWRMGLGHPAPLDLLTGMGSMELLEMSLVLLRRLLLEDPRWVFVSRRSLDRLLDPMVEHLDEMEFVVLKRLRYDLEDQVATGHYTRHHRVLVDGFIAEVGPKLVLGAFRVGPMSPARYFVAHEERVYEAALIAMADAVTTQPSGLPALVQLARASSDAAVGGPEFERAVQQAYLDAGVEERFHRGEFR